MEAPPKLGSSMPCEESLMPSERYMQLNKLPCCMERADLSTNQRCDCIVPNVQCLVLVQCCRDLPIANSHGSRSAATAGLIPGIFISLVYFGEFFCKSRHIHNSLIIFEFFSSLLYQGSEFTSLSYIG